MISLKGYQTRVLDSLRGFMRQCSRDGRPDDAYRDVQAGNGFDPGPYLPVKADGLSERMPYVCLRVPTGGGKTLLACHAAGIAQAELLQAEKSVVLWLVPSTTILDQTADALRDPRHPYRRALETSCGAVEVVTIEEAINLSRATVDGQTVVIVATIQSFRVEDTTGRKVYGQSGNFPEHFLNLPPDRLADLLPGPDGKPVPSLVNMLRLRRPIVIVDEAHNARTDLSFSTLGQVLPSCIIEFTATPARSEHPSNVLHRVSAAELKAEDMVKLPLRVITRDPGQRDQLLADAVALRAELEKLAGVEGQKTGEYLRPILLLQAESVAACEPLREQLVSQCRVEKDQVKISVGGHDELKDIDDVASPKCGVRFIITVQKLKEGWDCPFAYVLCSLRETRSPTAMEQIAGRILRLPGAKAKLNPDLNCSYAFSVSPSIATVLSELRDALEANGFTPAEAERIIIPVTAGVLPLGVSPQTVALAPAAVDAAAVQAQVEALGGKIRFDAKETKLTILVPLDDAEVARLDRCVKTPEARKVIEETAAVVRAAEKALGGNGLARQSSPYEQQLEFSVPILCVREGKDLLEFESTFLIEQPWKLSELDASLNSRYDPRARPTGKAGIVDIGQKGKVEAGVVSEGEKDDFISRLHGQVLALGLDGEWSMEELVAWLEWQIPHQDIVPGEFVEFVRQAVRGTMTRLGIPDIGVLALDRFRLRDEIDSRVQQHRDAERKKAFQAFLLPASSLVVSPEHVVDFRTMLYAPSELYDGGYQFKRHYFAKVGELKERKAYGGLTEEFQCAQFIDELPQVKYWVKNLSRRPTSFRLQTSKDWFYPDFVCQLQDGRVLVVEYKGEHLYIDAEEKRLVGNAWASRSGGRCLFVMPTKGEFSSMMEAVR